MRPRRRLPSLNAIRAFEVAARRKSFTEAAEELNVTPSAVSHRVKSLEDDLGVSLFVRHNRALELTENASKALSCASEGFRALAQAVETMRGEDYTVPISFKVAPALTIKWLMPRLQRFSDRHPNIDLRLSAGLQGAQSYTGTFKRPPNEQEEARGPADVEIRFGHGDYPGFRVTKLFSASLIAVCSIDLFDDGRSLKDMDDIRHFNLLHNDLGAIEGLMDWKRWARHFDVDDLDFSRGPHFANGALTIEAAAGGLGVALVTNVVAAQDLKAGRLAQLFDVEIPLTHAYYIVSPDDRATRPPVVALTRWLLEEASA